MRSFRGQNPHSLYAVQQRLAARASLGNMPPEITALCAISAI
jgi:hypothetical protein